MSVSVCLSVVVGGVKLSCHHHGGRAGNGTTPPSRSHHVFMLWYAAVDERGIHHQSKVRKRVLWLPSFSPVLAKPLIQRGAIIPPPPTPLVLGISTPHGDCEGGC